MSTDDISPFTHHRLPITDYSLPITYFRSPITDHPSPMLIQGNTHTDPRGIIRFVNDFTFEGIKRFYTITHPDSKIIRAWQGHRLETKYFYVAKGSFLINWLLIDNWEHPSKNLAINSKILTDKQSEVLIVKSGHVNGFKALEPDSSIIVFSDFTLEESKLDDFRWNHDYFNFDWHQS